MPRKRGNAVITFSFNGRRYSVSGRTKKEAIEKAALKKRQLEEGTVLVESSMLLKDWVALCYEKYKTNVAENTLRKDRAKAEKWIVDTLGNMPLNRVKPLDIQGVLNSMTGQSEYHIKRIFQIFNWVFEKAVENDLIARNPTKGVIRPKGTKTERRAITDQERKHLLLVADENPQLRFFLFMLFCGCRPSEVANLQGRDIVIQDGQPLLHIRGTKTKNADRTVPIPQYLYQRLPSVSKFDYLFTTAQGRPLDEQARKRLWNRCKRELNISMGCKLYRNELIPPFPVAADLTPYCFRHTYCTDLAKAGIPITTAKELMGHSDIKLTANIYTHVDTGMILSVADALEAYTIKAVG